MFRSKRHLLTQKPAVIVKQPIPLFVIQKFLTLKIMGFSVLPCLIITVFWGLIGIVLPIFLPKGNNRGLIQLSLILTAATAWLFWLCAYMAQMNPLIGPKLKSSTIWMMAQEWGNPITDL